MVDAFYHSQSIKDLYDQHPGDEIAKWKRNEVSNVAHLVKPNGRTICNRFIGHYLVDYHEYDYVRKCKMCLKKERKMNE